MAQTKIKNIAAPKTIHDLRVRHFKTLTDVKFKGEVNITLIAEFVAGITGVDLVEIYRVDTKDLVKIFNHCVGLFKGFKPAKEPPKEIEIEGKKYSLVNPHKVAVGWHIDLDASDIEANPLRLAALMYIPKGVTYGLLDENKNIVYPLAEREQIFDKHFKLIDFLSASDFIKRKYLVSIND